MSDTATELDNSFCRIGQLCSPTSYDNKPSQILVGFSMRSRLPAASDWRKSSAVSGSTPIIFAAGREIIERAGVGDGEEAGAAPLKFQGMEKLRAAVESDPALFARLEGLVADYNSGVVVEAVDPQPDDALLQSP